MKRDTQMNNMELHSKMQIWAPMEEQALLVEVDVTGQLENSWSIYVRDGGKDVCIITQEVA